MAAEAEIAKLSTLAQYDDISRITNVLIEANDDENKLILKVLRIYKHEAAMLKQRTSRLKEELDKNLNIIATREFRNTDVKKTIQKEIAKNKKLEAYKHLLKSQIERVREVLSEETNSLDEITKEKLAFLNNIYNNQISEETITIPDFDQSKSTEISYDKTDEDIQKDDSVFQSEDAGANDADPQLAEIRENRVALNKTISNISRPSIYPRGKSEDIQDRRCFSPIDFSLSLMKQRTTSRFSLVSKDSHKFVTKSMFKLESCSACGQRIGFSKSAIKCEDCRIVSHPHCKKKVPSPCLPLKNVSRNDKGRLDLNHFIGNSVPLVPSFLVDILNEIEKHGLKEPDLYRIPGKKSSVYELKCRLFGKKRRSSIRIVNVHDLCSLVKDFFRSLKEPLLTSLLWDEFAVASAISDCNQRTEKLQDVVMKLPRANKDTLAMLMLHLQKIVETPACKMSTTILAQVVGPAVVGFPGIPNPTSMLEDSSKQILVLEKLLGVQSSFWEKIIQMRITPTPNTSTPII